MEAGGGGEKHSSYSFLTSALDGGEWSASRPGRALPPEKGPPGRRLGAGDRRKILCPCRGSNPDRPARATAAPGKVNVRKPSSNAGDTFLESGAFVNPRLLNLILYGFNGDTGTRPWNDKVNEQRIINIL
jgi:hypothetical protein